MVHRSNLLNWLKTKIDGISREDETDHVHIECSLIRAISEYREKELSKISLEDDFNKRLMNRLDHIELESVETYSYETPKTFNFPVLVSAGFALALVVVTFTVMNVDDNSNPHFHKFPAHVTPIGLNSNSYSQMHIEEETLIEELKNNPDNIRLLEKLETYYFENGKKVQATEIHSMLETISKRY
ncbi:MAG: hypothetical protein KA146_00355 [Leptospiraceae bacterium]|nr:hypothetical protein [Leptospiraceae bacterium]